MRYKSLVGLGIVGAIALSMLGCKSEVETKVAVPDVQIKTIGTAQYELREKTLTQLTNDEDNKATYAVLSDIHGQTDKLPHFLSEFEKRGVEGIIVPGDIVNNEKFSGRGKQWNDAKEMVHVLTTLAETGLPVFVIPGNHERKADYIAAMNVVTKKYDNVIDMNEIRTFNGDDVDFVSLPGYTNQRFTAPGGFYLSEQDVKNAGEYTRNLDDTVILIAHGAPQTSNPGPGTIVKGQDVGDFTTASLMKRYDINFAVTGNIHEAGGLAANLKGEPIREGVWSGQFAANFGGLDDWPLLDGTKSKGMAGILSVRGEQAKFEMIRYE